MTEEIARRLGAYRATDEWEVVTQMGVTYAYTRVIDYSALRLCQIIASQADAEFTVKPVNNDIGKNIEIAFFRA